MRLRNLLPHRHRWTRVVTASRGDRTVGVTVCCGRCSKCRRFRIERTTGGDE